MVSCVAWVATAAHAGPAAVPPAPTAPAAHAATTAPVDPLEKLRARLAERLGRRVATNHESPRDVKLVTHLPAAAPSAALAGQKARKPAPAVAVEGPGKGHDAPGWSYEGATGPHAWAQLKPEFALCGRGRRQSPIDIRDGMALPLDELHFDYRASAVRVVDTGHTVQADVDGGNFLSVMGRRYELVQFHFHRPSEERIDGRQFEMSVHLVHRDAAGALAVVAVLLEPGPAHPVVQTVWSALPLEPGGVLAASTPINPADLLPTDRRYYTYMGSLTTPPCTEEVVWVVLQQPVAVSAAQVGVFARLYPMNARPVQPVAGRRIKQSQ